MSESEQSGTPIDLDVRHKSVSNFAPAILLMLFAPLLTEVLPGATRFGSIFVFPIEVTVWGGGALLIRDAVRRWNLGWFNMLLLALCLSIAEEFLIQQTSVAPMVLRLKGVTYARSLGVNYVYLLWALIYETVFVVFAPIYLVELIFPQKRHQVWMNRIGFITVIFFFLAGAFLAWYSWTQIARPKVFQVPAYNPSLLKVMLASGVIVVFMVLALGPLKNKLPKTMQTLTPPLNAVLGIIGALWATILFGLVLLAFGQFPEFPPAIALVAGFILMISAVYFVPRWTSSELWNSFKTYSLIFGTTVGSWVVGFIGFIGSDSRDLYFKIITNVIALILMLLLFRRVNRDHHNH